MRAVILVAAMVTVALGTFQKGLNARFDLDTSEYGEKSFMKIPLTSTEAESDDDWVLTSRGSGWTMPGLLMYCYAPGYYLCGLYENDTCTAAGVRFSIPKENIQENVLEWDTQGYKNWTLTVDSVSTEMHTAEVYFVSEASQNLSPEDRIAYRDTSRILCEGSVWMTGFYGELMQLPAPQDQFLASANIFTEQACINGMGLHYYYNMTNTTECSSSSLLKHFVLMDDEEINAIAITVFPNFTVPSDERDWFESPTEAVVEVIVPNGPECMYNMLSTYGARTCHLYFTDAPLNITCT